MEAIRYISIDDVLHRIKRVNPWLDSINFYDVCVYIDESYGLIGAPRSYIDQVTGNSLIRPNVTVTDYAGELPPDLIEIKKAGVRDVDSNIVYRHATDSFHKAPAFTGNTPAYNINDKTYSVRNGYIYIGDKTATLQIAYRAVPVDDRGFPMIVDKPKFKKAIEATILYYEGWKRYSVKRLGERVWREIDSNYHWWMAAAGSEGKNLHPDELESFKNAYTRLNPKVNFHASSFKFAGIQEDLNIGT